VPGLRKKRRLSNGSRHSQEISLFCLSRPIAISVWTSTVASLKPIARGLSPMDQQVCDLTGIDSLHIAPGNALIKGGLNS
jgi:hypothetical protein